MQKYIKNNPELLFTKEFLNNIRERSNNHTILNYLMYNEKLPFKESIEKIEEFLNKYEKTIESDCQNFHDAMEAFSLRNNLNN